MGRLIEVDITRLENESNSLREMMAEIDKDVASMEEAVTELSTMWKGPTNQIFTAQFESDKEVFSDVSKEVTECVKGMQEAAVLYKKCEDNNASVVSAIKI